MVADLDIDVDGYSARLEGEGQRLVLRSDQPHLLWSSLIQASVPDAVGHITGVRSAGRAAAALAEVGMHLDVEGPHGTVVSIGEGENSVIGRIITGSKAIRPRSARSLLPFVRVIVGNLLGRNKT